MMPPRNATSESYESEERLPTASDRAAITASGMSMPSRLPVLPSIINSRDFRTPSMIARMARCRPLAHTSAIRAENPMLGVAEEKLRKMVPSGEQITAMFSS